MKGIISICLFLMMAAYFTVSTLMVQQKNGETVCQNIQILITDSTAAQLVLPQDILSILEKNEMHLVGEKLSQINLYELEQLMKQEKGIDNCDAYTHLNGTLTLRITQRSPLLRLETPKGSYYIDNTGALFPTIAQRTAYVPVVSGNPPIENEAWITQLYNFGLFIRNNRFWNAQIEQLYIHNLNNIELIPRAGAHTAILLGSLDHFEYKLQKLYTFYRTVASSQGWNKYNTIDLRFNHQIICH